MIPDPELSHCGGVAHEYEGLGIVPSLPKLENDGNGDINYYQHTGKPDRKVLEAIRTKLVTFLSSDQVDLSSNCLIGVALCSKHGLGRPHVFIVTGYRSPSVAHRETYAEKGDSDNE